LIASAASSRRSDRRLGVFLHIDLCIDLRIE
jgi:hypothetical protein